MAESSPSWWKIYLTLSWKAFQHNYSHCITDIINFPLKVALSPITLALNFADYSQRGFGVPLFISKLSLSAVFAVATFGTWDIIFGLGRRMVSPRKCRLCLGWNALRCTMCGGSGRVQYQVKNICLRSGEKPTAESVADAIADDRAEIVHVPSTVGLDMPLPTKDCLTCDGSGVMKCPECVGKWNLTLSAADLMNPPSVRMNIMRKMHFPHEIEDDSEFMKALNMAASTSFTVPLNIGGVEYDEVAKQKMWWEYEEAMRYDNLQNAIQNREPGWEHLQDLLISSDPSRSKSDQVMVRNIPFYKAKKALEAEVMMLVPPPRPVNWGEFKLPLDASNWDEEELKDPKKVQERDVLLAAQKGFADRVLNQQWEKQWRQEKVNELLKEKVKPYIEQLDDVLPHPIIVQPTNLDEKKSQRKRWWFL